jgi:uncharacterized membrane protein HdeD (DUF308 family)
MTLLRGILIVIAIVSILCGLVALATGAFPPAAIFAVWGVLLVVGTVFERVIYKQTMARPPGAGWVRTTERFIDDATGKPITVYVEPATGERQYIEE